MMDLQAAIGLHQLDRLEAAVRRREIWGRYNEAFPNAGRCPAALRSARSARPPPVHDPGRRVGGRTTRDAFLAAMTARGSASASTTSIPEHPYYQETFGWHLMVAPRHKDRPSDREPAAIGAIADADVDDVIEAVCRTLA